MNASFRYFFYYFSVYRRRIYLGIFLSVCFSIIGPLKPKIIQLILDETVKTVEFTVIYLLIGLFLLVTILETAIRYKFQLYTAEFSQQIVMNLRNELFDKIIHLPQRYFDQTKVGILATRTISDVETINDLLTNTFFSLITDFLTIFIVLGFMFYIDVPLTLMSLLVLPFVIILTYVFKEQNRKLNHVIRRVIGELAGFIQENLRGLKIIKAYRAEDFQNQKHQDLVKDFYDANFKTIKSFSWFLPLMEIAVTLSTIFFICLLAYRTSTLQSIDIGKVSAFVLYIQMLYRPIRFIADRFNVVQSSVVALERIYEMLQLKTEDTSYRLELKEIKGTIKIENLSFCYQDKFPIINNVTLNIPSGKTTAIVGNTGSGKTTLINLILRLYDGYDGRITLDDVNIQEYHLNRYRQAFSVVNQDVFILSGTILENLQFGNLNITEQGVLDMINTMNLQGILSGFEDGLSQKISANSGSLSFGQRQVISIFRAILQQKQIIVLDEATASIDSNTEALIQRMMGLLMKDKTALVIAHRISTIVDAHQIVVMNQGRIEAIGTHEVLLEKSEVYQQFFERILEK
ncbi:MAG: ABC transporter ATP-binding protein/permease [Chitinophagales bacterium]|jgi:ATP-binding cassette subfamily B protein|nr:ABC transporter ATP-binding protein/permease [Chitinophagales bacterium]